MDANCIGCSVCPEIAADIFRSNLEEGYEYVYKQPSCEEEERLCAEAMEMCPVNAIRKNEYNLDQE